MSTPKRDDHGRFAGSIGNGKDKIPSPALSTSHIPEADDASSPDTPDYALLSRAVTERLRDGVQGTSEDFEYVSHAETAVRQAAAEWEATREWAHPGVGDLEAEEELAKAYDNLALQRENLFRARTLAAQSEKGRNLLVEQMQEWHARGEAAAASGEDAIKYLVRAQEIHDVLVEAEKQRAVEEEFQRIIAQADARTA